MDASAKIFHVAKAIDERPVGSLLVQVAALCAMVAFLNGLDTSSIGISAPLIADSLRLTQAHLGPVFSAGLFGAVIGTPVMGSLADRFGRKRILVLSTLIFGVFTIATAFANTFSALLIIRFIGGVGLGGATPCFIALASEYAPVKHRAVVTSLVWAAWPIGANAGAIMDAIILARLGWHSVFLIGGAFPIVAVLILMVWLPESIRFLLTKKRDSAQMRRIVSRIAPGVQPDVQLVNDEIVLKGSPVSNLFSDGKTVESLLLWVLFFVTVGLGTTIFFWAPTLMHNHGIPLPRAAVVLGCGGMGMLFGAANAGWLKEKFGAIATMVPALIIGGAGTAAVGYASYSLLWMAADLAVISFCVGGIGVSGGLALAAIRYPTAMRSTGIGWAMGMGGLGQVLLQLLVSFLMSLGWGPDAIFQLLGVAPLLAATSVLLLELRRTSARTGEVSVL